MSPRAEQAFRAFFDKLQEATQALESASELLGQEDIDHAWSRNLDPELVAQLAMAFSLGGYLRAQAWSTFKLLFFFGTANGAGWGRDFLSALISRADEQLHSCNCGRCPKCAAASEAVAAARKIVERAC